MDLHESHKHQKYPDNLGTGGLKVEKLCVIYYLDRQQKATQERQWFIKEKNVRRHNFVYKNIYSPSWNNNVCSEIHLTI